MPKPSTFSWASVSAIWRTAISSLTQDQGQAPLTPAVVEEVNQALYLSGEWVKYVDTIIPQDAEIEVGRITGIGDPDGSGRGLVITTDGTGTGILLSPASGDALTLTTTGAADVVVTSAQAITATAQTEVTAGTFVGADRTGIRADHANRRVRIDGGVGENGAGFRYPYQASDPLDVIVDVGPSCGSYAVIDVGLLGASAPNVKPITDAPGGYYLYNAAGSAQDVGSRRSLELTRHNGDTSTGLLEVVSLTSVWDGTTADTSLRFIRRTRASGAETVLLEVDYTATSDTNGGTPIALDTDTYSYLLEFFGNAIGSASPTNKLITATLTLRKYAVE